MAASWRTAALLGSLGVLLYELLYGVNALFHIPT